MDIKQDGYFHETKFIDQNGHLRTTRVPVVQELALKGLKDLPKRFISLKPDSPLLVPTSCVQDGSDSSETLHPPIDVAKLRYHGLGSEGRTQELARLASVVKEMGMFLIVNHGIECCVLEDVKDVVKGFFGLSFEEKRESVGTYMDVDNMGYGRNFVKSEDQPLDWIDRLTMKAAPKDATDGLLVWPQKPPNFRQVMEKYVEEARKVCNDLLVALAEALSLENHAFLQNFDHKKSEINVRVNYYPPCPRPDLALGLTPHTDGSALTFLMQFRSASGLQVLRDLKWVAVPWPADVLLVSVGDLLEIMSGGRLKSPWHRVVTQMDVERFSISLFYNPPVQAEIEPVVDGYGSSNEVPWPADVLLVSVGDLLEIMSGGRLKSPWHRVVTQIDVERFSISLFYNPSAQAQIEPVVDGYGSSNEGPWPADVLLVSVGDLLEIMSGGRLKSPWHRVVTQMDVERFLISLFYNPPAQA
ncbi:putative 2-oxoglutarate/Fe(II)-dependent dioxygenase [Camellia lanceoleosa]|uniref:2-oxoglutarate/Fe(II)-dependent dioxygenase n=1 Tax=Camellia lanceoleosa TaxID=1840588 RepID=A0ACC0IPJ0_9ERIC|nr:putative 2-oxoglutarate/Fe(II)-dependent dioxygenase [Camellia lanceoleosa]